MVNNKDEELTSRNRAVLEVVKVEASFKGQDNALAYERIYKCIERYVESL